MPCYVKMSSYDSLGLYSVKRWLLSEYSYTMAMFKMRFDYLSGLSFPVDVLNVLPGKYSQVLFDM